MYLILMNRVILGVDGFINGPQHIGSQVRVCIIWLNVIINWGDKYADGNGLQVYLKLNKMEEFI